MCNAFEVTYLEVYWFSNLGFSTGIDFSVVTGGNIDVDIKFLSS